MFTKMIRDGRKGVVTFIETNDDDKILYQKGKIVELLSLEEARIRMYQDGRDKDVIRIENHTYYNELIDAIFELSSNKLVPKILGDHGYYYCNSRFADIIDEGTGIDFYKKGDLNLKPSDDIIIRKNPNQEIHKFNIYSMKQKRIIAELDMETEYEDGEDCIPDNLNCIGDLLAQEGYVNIGIFFQL